MAEADEPSDDSGNSWLMATAAWLKREWLVALAISIVAGFIVAGALWAVGKVSPEPPEYREQIAYSSEKTASYDIYSADTDGLNAAAVASGPLSEYAADYSTRGGRLAYVVSDESDDSSAIHIGDPLTGVAEVVIPGEAGGFDFAPSWDGTGQRLAFTRSVGGAEDVFTYNVDSGETTQLTSGGGAYPNWNPVRSQLLYETPKSAGNRDLKLLNLDTMETASLTTDSADDIDPEWTPDGESVVFSSNRNGGNYDMFILDVASGEVEQLTKDAEDETDAAVSPDGRHIAYTYGQTSFDTDVRIMSLSGANQREVVAGPTNESNPSWGGDGSRIYFEKLPQGDSNIDRLAPGADDPLQLMHSDAGEYYPSWSPDGKRIAFSSDAAGHYHIWTASMDGKDLQRLTTDDADDFLPCWSPDGERLVFTRGRSPDVDLFLVSVEPASEAVRLTKGGATDPDWNPDGSSILFVSDRSGESELYQVDLVSGVESKFAEVGGQVSSPRWSPDGKTVLFTRRTDISSDVALFDVGSQKVEVLLGDSTVNDSQATWSPDGRQIAWVSDRDGAASVYFADVDDPVGTAKRLVDDGGSRHSNPAWGRRTIGD
jgi:Tol biopolymer transport system component